MPALYRDIAMQEAQSPFPDLRFGLATRVVDALLASGRLTAVELDRLAIPRKTLAHRRLLGHLTPEQSDRLDRLMRMIGLAEETFGNPAKAATWLRRPNRALAGEPPLDFLDTDRGCRLVEDLLDRIAQGIAA